MSYLTLRRTHEIGVEIHAECKACGAGVRSEASESVWCPEYSTRSGILVKVQPFCSRCLRERDERFAGAIIHREE